MKLTGRLECIANMVKPCSVLCDIGTDHAYIPMFLVRNCKISYGIASDIREGPCGIALSNIVENDLQDKIEVRRGNGFESIKEGECDSAVIAGMGGNMIISIFQRDSNILRTLKQVVLQPQNAHEILREYLYVNGYDIENESIVYDDGKFYVVMSVRYDGTRREKQRINYYIGERLIESRDKFLKAFLTKEIERLSRILNQTENDEYIWLLNEYNRIWEEIIDD